MPTFNKKNEVIEKVKDFGGFLKVRELESDNNLLNFTDKRIIEAIISSRFHFWEGEKEPNGITIQMSSSDKDKNVKKWVLDNYKFYGFFDNSKIKPEHYKHISLDSFNDKLFKAINEQADYDALFIDKANKMIMGFFDNSSMIYFLDLDKEINPDLVAEWHPYDFFYAFIAIDRPKNILTLIEFGLD